MKDAGLTVFHVVPSLNAALKAVDAGVDGLVVEGGEGGGFKSPRDVATMVLLPLVRSKTDVPIIAAGGIADGVSMAAAFALGAEGVQMGTRMVSAAESPIHDNWKQADHRLGRDRHGVPQPPLQAGLRVLRTERSESMEREDNVWAASATCMAMYFGGDMEAALPFGGQVAGRIESVEPVASILERTMDEFTITIKELTRYL